MARGPRYKRSLRRRNEGKTDYHKRLKLLKSRKRRVTIRASNDHMRVQIIQSFFVFEEWHLIYIKKIIQCSRNHNQ